MVLRAGKVQVIRSLEPKAGTQLRCLQIDLLWQIQRNEQPKQIRVRTLQNRIAAF